MPDTQPPARSLRFSGYHRNKSPQPDLYLAQVGAGTPGGEYQRRFWHPVAYLTELDKVPLRVRALGEDLVLYKDRGGNVGCLALHCCHRNTSLEFGIIQDRGLKCCYHGRVFDADGTILDVPGEPNAEHMKRTLSQGAYPTHVFAGLVFIYMGPPERVPVFPVLDRMDLKGVKLVPGERLPYDCNWLQIKENSLDPIHTYTLHMIPQTRGYQQFSDEFGIVPLFIWTETPAGCMYLGVRHVGDNIWVRSTDTYGPNLHMISSIVETGRQHKSANAPFLSMWTLPVDDGNSINFYISHVADDEKMPWPKRREIEKFGQFQNDRPYAERQWIPGDYDAMSSQGAINPHSSETLGSQDRGVVMFRRYVRTNIEAVQAGQDPQGFFLRQEDVAPTFASDYVTAASDAGGDPDDPGVQRAFAERLAAEYLQRSPMTRWPK
jgi:phenylpropionate dioxygenase-like ring-hydroxylating dioxygenase large terminal subunit